MSNNNKQIIDLTTDESYPEISLRDIGTQLRSLPDTTNNPPPQYNTLLDFCSKLENLPVFEGLTANYEDYRSSPGARKRRKVSKAENSPKQEFAPLTDLVSSIQRLPKDDRFEYEERKRRSNSQRDNL
jgi:hypothetical protein